MNRVQLHSPVGTGAVMVPEPQVEAYLARGFRRVAVKATEPQAEPEAEKPKAKPRKRAAAKKKIED